MLCLFVLKERAQMEAIQALQLQTDAKHRRITSQVIQSNTRYPAAKYSFFGSEPWVHGFLYCSSFLALSPIGYFVLFLQKTVRI